MKLKLSIIIPAYNEENRIEKTLREYFRFFSQKQSNTFSFEFVVVLNGCKDNTIGVVERVRNELQTNTIIINLTQAGKGLAIKAGFADALTRNNDIIGYVDADMATLPEHFYDLITHMHNNDGVIASRYMQGAHISPPRPLYKRWGSKFIYEPYIWLLFGISYYDFQCGAKIFKRAIIEKITPLLTVKGWAIDVEILYLAHRYGFKVIEIPTTWTDQAGSKLTLQGGFRMLSALRQLKAAHK